MNLIKKVLITYLVCLSSLFSDTMEMNLATFATYASETNNINILIDEELKEQNIIQRIGSAKGGYWEVKK